MKKEINADDLKKWYAAQELVYASVTNGEYSIRLTISQFSDFPTYEVMKRHVDHPTTQREQLYYGSDINAAVRIFNEAAEQPST